MLSHVAAGGEDHFDWFTVHVDAAGTTREVRLLDARNRSAPVRVRLAPSDQVHHRVDLCAWALRPRNGARALGSGDHDARVVYVVDDDPQAWTGRLEAGPVTISR